MSCHVMPCHAMPRAVRQLFTGGLRQRASEIFARPQSVEFVGALAAEIHFPAGAASRHMVLVRGLADSCHRRAPAALGLEPAQGRARGTGPPPRPRPGWLPRGPRPPDENGMCRPPARGMPPPHLGPAERSLASRSAQSAGRHSPCQCAVRVRGAPPDQRQPFSHPRPLPSSNITACRQSKCFAPISCCLIFRRLSSRSSISRLSSRLPFCTASLPSCPRAVWTGVFRAIGSARAWESWIADGRARTLMHVNTLCCVMSDQTAPSPS